MDEMDPDAEFNVLTTIYQSVVHDMKQTYPGWDALSQKAQKLGTQLRATAQCLASFVEAMQGVCDNANNLKGASRDVGACVTRVCIKQRAIESRMRAWADALCDELALTLQQRGSYWKSRCHELDKMAAKHVKKVRARKQQRPDITAMNEQREICGKVLVEQRTQFAFFIGALVPVLNAQLSMLDEGAHLRQVVDNLDSTVKHVDTDHLVSTIVSDVSQGPDTAWKQCLNQAGQKWRSSSNNEDAYSCLGSMTRATTPASSHFSSEDGMGTLTNARSASTSCAAKNLIESSASSVISSSTRYSSHNNKPPLQRRNSEKSIGQFSMSSPNTDGSTTYLNYAGQGMTGNSSSNTITELSSQFPQNGHHPISRTNSMVSSGGGGGGGGPPAYQQVISQRMNIQRPQNLNFETFTTSSCIGGTPTAYQPTTPANVASSGSSTAASTSALLITEACKEIDQLGSDLENYCAMTCHDQTRYFVGDTSMDGVANSKGINRRASHAGGASDYSSMQVIDQGKRASINMLSSSNSNNFGAQGSVRMRTTSASRPPPPARRSSQITAATPTAPSVAEQRMNGSMGSRQSLDSAGLYDNNVPLQHPQQMYGFARPTQTAASKYRI